MAKKINKTNCARILDGAKIEYNLICYEVDENNLGATHVAEQLGENSSQVYKTLVLRGDKSGIFVVLISADKEIDLKMAAKVSGNKKCEMIAMKELLPTTGYIRGACSPIGMKKQFPTFIDVEAIKFETIFISGGIRGMQIEIDPKKLIELIQIKEVEL